MDPKDWFSNCMEYGKRYETRWLDNGLCNDCNNKDSIKLAIQSIISDINECDNSNYSYSLSATKGLLSAIKVRLEYLLKEM